MTTTPWRSERRTTDQRVADLITHLLTHRQEPPGPWVEDALCAQTDPDAFYPEKGGSTRHAKAICATCPVVAECLDYALTAGERHGIWGGKSERERRSLARQRNAA